MRTMLALLLGMLTANAQYATDVMSLGENSIRIRVAPHALAEPIIGALNTQSATKPEILQHTADLYTATNGNLQVTVNQTNGFVKAVRVSDGKVLIQTTELLFGTPPAFAAKNSTSVNVTFATPTGGTERIYGLGEHYGKKVDLLPYSKTFADSLFYGESHGTDVSIPWYCSSHEYGFVWNNPSLGTVNITNGMASWSGQAVQNLDFWVTTTPAQPSPSIYADLLKQYADATGHALPMPEFSTGFIQSKDRYRNQTQLMTVAREYVRRGLPISMIVIDWFHWKEMGDWSLNPLCWPDPQGMVDELRDLGIELMITVWPFVGINVSSNWQEFSEQGYLANSTATGQPESFWRYNTPTGNPVVDSTNPAAMKSVMDHWWDGYGKYGVRAVWMDESEPDHSSYISGGQWDFHAGSDSEILPAWVRFWANGFRNGLESRGHKPGEFFILSRNAWPGTPSDGAALWSGDVQSTWEVLEQSVAVSQQVAMSGIPLWTTDIGGYFSGNPATADFQQLIVRWFQFGAFCPVFRLHGQRVGGPPTDQCGATNGDNEVWNLAPDPAHYSAIEAVMKLREQLRPYVLKLNQVTVDTGLPMLRPMFLEFPGDDELFNVEGQFMLGPDWLIAPVTAANATTWDAYLPNLPAGQQWVYWWNQTVVQTTGQVSVSVASLSDFPLFYRRSS